MKKITQSIIKIFVMMLMFTFVTQSATAQASAKIDSYLAKYEQLRDQYPVNSAKYNYVNQMVTFYTNASASASGNSNAEQVVQQAGTKPQVFPYALKNYNAQELTEIEAFVTQAEAQGGAILQSIGYLKNKHALQLN